MHKSVSCDWSELGYSADRHMHTDGAHDNPVVASALLICDSRVTCSLRNKQNTTQVYCIRYISSILANIRLSITLLLWNDKILFSYVEENRGWSGSTDLRTQRSWNVIYISRLPVFPVPITIHHNYCGLKIGFYSTLSSYKPHRRII